MLWSLASYPVFADNGNKLVSALPMQVAMAGISIEIVDASLKEGTPKATLEKFFSCEKYEGSAYEKIAMGEPRWISIAEKMLQHSDACYTEGIQAALGSAMQKFPKRLLPLVDKTSLLSANYICLPFISSELPVKSQVNEINKSKKAIQNVKGKNLISKRMSCLDFINSVETSILKRH